MSMIIDGTSGSTYPDSTSQGTAYLGANVVLFTASGTWTPPAGVTKAIVTVIGAGGGGSYGTSGASTQNGGRGGVAQAYITTLSGAVTITVGTGGNGGVSGSTTGGTGGTTSFGSLLSATGGTGGTTSASGTAGTGTVSSGTGLFAGSSANFNAQYVGGVSSAVVATGANTPAPSAYNPPNGTYMAGTAGGSNSGNASAGGIGGVVIIQY